MKHPIWLSTTSWETQEQLSTWWGFLLEKRRLIGFWFLCAQSNYVWPSPMIPSIQSQKSEMDRPRRLHRRVSCVLVVSTIVSKCPHDVCRWESNLPETVVIKDLQARARGRRENDRSAKSEDVWENNFMIVCIESDNSVGDNITAPLRHDAIVW